MTQVTDEQLIASYRSGDSKSRDLLVGRYVGVVKVLAGVYKSRLPNFLDVDDIISHGFDGLLKAIDTYNHGGGEFKPYVKYKIRFAFSDGFRDFEKSRRKFENKVVTSAFSTIPKLVTDNGSEKEHAFMVDESSYRDIGNSILCQELWHKIYNELTEADMQLVCMLFRDDLSTADIARKIGRCSTQSCWLVGEAMNCMRYKVGGEYRMRQRFLPSKRSVLTDICSAFDCTNETYSHAYCLEHFETWEKHGTIYIEGVTKPREKPEWLSRMKVA